MMVKGARSINSIHHSLPHQSLFSSFNFLSPWHKVYLCLDEDGISIYDSKSSPAPLVLIPLKDVEHISIELGTSTRNARSGTFTEDLFNIRLKLRNRDELYLRYKIAFTILRVVILQCNL